MTVESKSAFARRLGVAPGYVTQLRHENRLVIVSGRVDVEKSLALIEKTRCYAPHRELNKLNNQAKREAKKKAQEALTLAEMLGDAGEAPPKAAKGCGETVEASGDPSTEYTARQQNAVLREREAKAEKAAVELDKMVGLLVERSEVEIVFRDVGVTFRNFLENAADRIAPIVVAKQGDLAAVRGIIDREMRELLTEISEHMKRKAFDAQVG